MVVSLESLPNPYRNSIRQIRHAIAAETDSGKSPLALPFELNIIFMGVCLSSDITAGTLGRCESDGMVYLQPHETCEGLLGSLADRGYHCSGSSIDRAFFREQ